MKVIVTGCAGFIGRHLVKKLLLNGNQVIGIDNFCRGNYYNIEEFTNNRNFTFLKFDLSDYHNYEKYLEYSVNTIDAVWHMSANSDISAGINNPDIDFRDTFMTTFNTLKYMKNKNVPKLYFASTSAVYGDHGDCAITELTSPLHPISNYGAMKLASEAIISSANELFLKKVIVFRFPNVIGSYATHGIIYDLINKLKNSPTKLEVLGDGSQEKSYLHVEELIDAMFFLESNVGNKFEVFNIGPNEEIGVTVKFISETVRNIAAPKA
jgi:UDP-glucose 4-epimerase